MLDIDQNDELFVGDNILKDFGNCTDCGICCTYFDTLSLYPEEITSIASRLQIKETDFITRYTKTDNDQEISLQSPCPFLKKGTCMIYPYRFFICKTFPLCINLSKNQGILSGIYVCPQATQFYEGLLHYHANHHKKLYQKILTMEKKTKIDEKGMKIQGPIKLFSPYLDWLTSNKQ